MLHCTFLQIHWFSIINSCVTVLLLTGFLATILMRVLKQDFVKYSRDDRECAYPCRSHIRINSCRRFEWYDGASVYYLVSE